MHNPKILLDEDTRREALRSSAILDSDHEHAHDVGSLALVHPRLGRPWAAQPTSGVGRSHHEDGFVAGRAAAEAALEVAGGGEPAFTIIYGTVLYDQDAVLRGVRSVIPRGPLVGASTQGISTQGVVEEVDRVVGVCVVCSSSIRARSVVVTGLGEDVRGVAERLAAGIGPSPVQPVLMWYDPLTGANIQGLLDLLAERGIERVIGGGAGQPFGRQHRTYQYENTRAHGDAVVALVLEGEVELVYDVTHGTETLGVELTVTESTENLVTAIDGQRALDVLQEQMGVTDGIDVSQTADWALGLHLGIDADSYEGPITRAIFGINPETGAIVFQAPIPSGSIVQLCHRTCEAVHDRAVQMAHRLHERLADEQPFLLLSFECGARPRPFLGDDGALAEIQALQGVLGRELPWLGTYAWGELAPIGRRSYFHNYTFPLVALCRPRTRSSVP
jgi:hypothetical protein